MLLLLDDHWNKLRRGCGNLRQVVIPSAVSSTETLRPFFSNDKSLFTGPNAPNTRTGTELEMPYCWQKILRTYF